MKPNPAVDAVVWSIVDYGANPQLHARALLDLRASWPTLWLALRWLVLEQGVALPTEWQSR